MGIPRLPYYKNDSDMSIIDDTARTMEVTSGGCVGVELDANVLPKGLYNCGYKGEFDGLGGTRKDVGNNNLEDDNQVTCAGNVPREYDWHDVNNSNRAQTYVFECNNGSEVSLENPGASLVGTIYSRNSFQGLLGTASKGKEREPHYQNFRPAALPLIQSTESSVEQVPSNSDAYVGIPGVLAAAEVLINLPDQVQMNRLVQPRGGAAIGPVNTKVKDEMNSSGLMKRSAMLEPDLMKTSIAVPNRKGNVADLESPKNHSCSICGRIFQRRAKLKRHEKTHTGDKPFKCDIMGCCKCYSRKEHLTRHWEQVHNPNRKHLPCPHEGCTKVYLNVESFARHLKSHRSGGVFECPSRKASKLADAYSTKEGPGSIVIDDEDALTPSSICSPCSYPFGVTINEANRVFEPDMSSINGDEQQQMISKPLHMIDDPDKARLQYCPANPSRGYCMNYTRGGMSQGNDVIWSPHYRRIGQDHRMFEQNGDATITDYISRREALKRGGTSSNTSVTTNVNDIIPSTVNREEL